MSDEQEIQTNGEPEPADGAESTPAPADEAVSDASTAIDLAKVRDLVLAAHPDVVPEMVQGQSFDELMASVEPARAAYQRIASESIERAGAQHTAPKVAAQPGRRGAEIIDIDALSPLGKISEGLRRV